MNREYLSSQLVVPGTVITAIMLVGATIGMFHVQQDSIYEHVGLILFVGLLFVSYWVQSVVYIEGNEIVAERFGRTIRIEAEDICDVDYVRFTRLLRLSFHRNTAFGQSVIFASRTEFKLFEEGDSFSDGPTFERIGRFCGWKL